MLGIPVGNLIEPRKLLTASPETSVADAARLLKASEVGAVLVVDGDRLVGIFTERDAVYRVMAAGRDPSATRLDEVMTRDPITVSPQDEFGYALYLMHEHGFRHAPVVEGGRPVGVVSARYALDPDLEEFTVEAERRRFFSRRAGAASR